MAILETATLAAGCFWCVEAVFDDLVGVEDVVSGYSGGHTENPTYKEVCSETTGHAEVVQIVFDPSQLTFKELLQVYFTVHDPTTLNRQGHDTGTQYRSIILYHNDAQKAAAEKSKATAQKDWNKPIVTEIVPLKKFYQAEDYHQDYFRNHPGEGYCQMVIRPKVEKFEKSLKAEKK